jgi:hypothetical protein
MTIFSTFWRRPVASPAQSARSQRAHAERPARIQQHVAAIGASEAALDWARENPQMCVDIFERDWRTVDELRETVRSQGLDGRVSVRIMDALAFVELSVYDLVLRSAGPQHSMVA